MSGGRLVIREAEVGGAIVDVVAEHGDVVAVVRAGTAGGDLVIDAGGGALIPGLHDHHVHLLASAAARSSTPCGPPQVTDVAELGSALCAADAALPAGRWIRGVGYHESVAGELDRHVLDAIVPTRPCRVLHRSGHAWILNTVALAGVGATPSEDLPAGVEIDASDAPTGRLYELDDWLRDRVPSEPPALDALGVELSGYGVTAVTDATPSDPGALIAAIDRAGLRQTVAITGPPDLHSSLTGAGDAQLGPAKIVLADHQLPALDDVIGWFRQARSAARPVAVHCVTRAALLLALAAWDDVGTAPGDRIEHGAVVPDDAIARIAAGGLTVVTQPSFVADRGDDYLTEVDTDDLPHLWRCASLVAAGVPVAFGTDAPFGDADPWRAIAAAVHRRTDGGAVLGADERLPPRAALDRFLGPLERPGAPARRVVAGAPADLCLLDVPLDDALAEPSSDRVRLTVIAGEIATPGA